MTLRNAFDNLATETTLGSVKAATESITLLRRIAQLLKPLQQITGGGSNRLSVDINNVTGGTIGTVTTVTGVTTVSTVTSVTTVGSVTNAANVGGVSAFDMMKALSRQAYNSGIRTKIS